MNTPTEYSPPRGTAMGQPTPYPRSDQDLGRLQHNSVKFDLPLTSIKEQATSHASRHVTNTKEMIARHNEEIERLEDVLQDYRDAVEILKSTLPDQGSTLDDIADVSPTKSS